MRQNTKYVVQSIIFNKNKCTKDEAEKWLKMKKYKSDDIDEKQKTFRFRQIEPKLARRKNFKVFRTYPLGKSGISLIIAYHDKMNGGDLTPNEIADLLKKSYDENRGNVGDFVIDNELSNKSAQVYHNTKTGENVIVHRGTKGNADILSDIKYALGYNPDLKMRENTQKRAEEKYGKKLNVLAHSLGNISAIKANPDAKIYAVDRPVNIVDLIRGNDNPNLTDIRHKKDLVSALLPYQKRKGKLVEIDEPNSSWFDVIGNHKTSQVRKLKDDALL